MTTILATIAVLIGIALTLAVGFVLFTTGYSACWGDIKERDGEGW